MNTNKKLIQILDDASPVLKKLHDMDNVSLLEKDAVMLASKALFFACTKTPKEFDSFLNSWGKSGVFSDGVDGVSPD